MEFRIPGEHGDVPGHCAHVLRCFEGHYTVLRTVRGVDLRSMLTGFPCRQCECREPVPARLG